MARPLRIEFPGTVYHVTSRGDRREPIFVDDEDRRSMLDVVEQAMARFDAQALACCLMGNHYHLVLHTRQANLSRLMRHLYGVTTQDFNRRHGGARQATCRVVKQPLAAYRCIAAQPWAPPGVRGSG